MNRTAVIVISLIIMVGGCALFVLGIMDHHHHQRLPLVVTGGAMMALAVFACICGFRCIHDQEDYTLPIINSDRAL